MAVWVWFKPETVAKRVRKRVCCFPFLFGKGLFLVWSSVFWVFFGIRSNSKHVFMSKRKEGNLNSPAHSHLLGSQSFTAREGSG